MIPKSVLQIRADYVPGSSLRRLGILHMKRMNLELNSQKLRLQNFSPSDENCVT